MLKINQKKKLIVLCFRIIIFWIINLNIINKFNKDSISYYILQMGIGDWAQSPIPI